MTILLIGGSGAGLSTLLLCKRIGLVVNGFFDDRIHEGITLYDIPCLGRLSEAHSHVSNTTAFVSAIGSVKTILNRQTKFKSLMVPVSSYISIASRKAVLETAELLDTSPGIVVMDDVFIGYGCEFGKLVLINAKAYIGHGTRVGDYTIVGPNATISGDVAIGALCFIGAGCVIRDHISICDKVIIGCGSVVVSDICESGIYVGNPARRLSEHT